MRLMTYRGFLALAVVAASGCTVFAGKGDYADYREIRLARDADSRLYALQQYAEKHPDGMWAKDVEIERTTRETETFENGKGSREGLERYLRAYPDGTFAAQARSRLAAVALIERRRQAEESEAQQRLLARKQREQELQRTWVTRFAGYWSTTLVRLNGWGTPIPEVARQNPQFSRAFGALPRPRCTETECIKYYTSPYGIPVPGGTRVERVLSLVLRLRMQEGKLDRAELLLPAQGFSRWYELEQRKLVATGDGEGRNLAVSWAIDRLGEALKLVTADLSALASYSLAPIPAPAIAPSGELTDTTAEDPSEPPKQLTADGIGPAPQQQDVNALVKPKQAEGPADMVFSPLGVTKEGRTFQTPTQPGAVAPAPSSGEVMMMDPLAVPKDSAAASGTPNAPAGATPVEPTPAAVATPPVIRALQGRGLRVVMFAAAGDANGPEAYDGLIIERIGAPSSAAPAAAKPLKPKPAAAAAPVAPAKPVAPAAPPPPKPPAAAPAASAPAPH